MNKLLLILSAILVAVSIYNTHATDKSFANADNILAQMEAYDD